MQYLIQTRDGRRYTELFTEACRQGAYTHFHAAVAYATVGGVLQLEKAITGPLGDHWRQIEKRWLVGIDWCRSDPAALARLQHMPRSDVRVPGGTILVGRPGCTPSDTYHPKLFIFSGPDTIAVVCGSGNLSANGLRRGCECGSLLTIRLPAQARSADHEQVTHLIDWIGSAWLAADAYGGLREAYESICRTRARRKQLVPTEDDNRPPEPIGRSRRRGLSENQIRQLRTFDNLWIEAGALGANLGRGIPGNQLDMTRFTRAFFGSPVDDVPPNTDIDDITLIWDGDAYPDRTLKFGDNGMDKLNVPPAADRGPEFYRGKTLLFTRQADGTFDFTVGSDADKAAWRHRSEREGVVHHVGRRAWGLF